MAWARDMAFLQPGQQRTGRAVRWKVPQGLSVCLPAGRSKNTPWRKRNALFISGAADVTLRIQRQSRSIRALLLSPHISLVAFLVAVAGSPMRLFLLPLFHSSGLCYFSSKYSNYFPYFYCFFSYFCYLSSSHYAFFFFIVSHPSRPHPQKRRIKETAVNKTCKWAVLSDDFHFIWAVPLNRWRKILF